MLNVEMQTCTYIGSTIVQIYYTILADIVRHILGHFVPDLAFDIHTMLFVMVILT